MRASSYRNDHHNGRVPVITVEEPREPAAMAVKTALPNNRLSMANRTINQQMTSTAARNRWQALARSTRSGRFQSIMKRKQRYKSAFTELFQHWGEHTTLHGVRFVVDKSRLSYQRIAWLLAVVVCVGYLLYQISARVTYYYSNPVTVNVEINKKSFLDFPTVTICNQNAFRLTRAAEDGLYQSLSKVYSPRGALSRRLALHHTEHFVSNMSMEEIFSRTAHDIHSMLIRCSWYGQNCTAANFTKVYTDHGVCFAFNLEGTSLAVNDTGSGNGLSLLLNIQQYEYMVGPFQSAGVRFHMHTRRTVPLVTDLGQAAAVGTHTFVGMKVVKSISLKPPQGKCSLEEKPSGKNSVKNCVLECRLKFFHDHCKCREYYIPNSDNLTMICSLAQTLSCVQQNENNFQYYRRSPACKCANPCEDMFYEPNLSFSSVSNLGLHALGSEETVVRRLQQEHIYARDVAAILQESIFTVDRKELESFVTKFWSLYNMLFQHLAHFIHSLETFTKAEMQYHLENHSKKEKLLQDQLKVVKANWVRGFDSADERTFSLVSHQFFEYSYQFREQLEMVAQLNSDNSSRQQEGKEGKVDLFTFETLVALNTRRRCAEASHSKVMELYNCYFKGKPYFTKKIPLGMTLEEVNAVAPKGLLHAAVANQSTEFMDSYGLRLNSTYTEMAALVMEAKRTGRYDKQRYKQLDQKFVEYSKAWLDYRAVVLRRSFYAPVESLKDRITSFTRDHEFLTGFEQTLKKDYEKLRGQLNVSQKHIRHLTHLVRHVENYLSNFNKTRLTRNQFLKSHLATEFTNSDSSISEFIQILQKLSENLRFYSMNWPVGWSKFLNRLCEFWEDILTDADAQSQYAFHGATFWVGRNFTLFGNNLTRVYNAMQENFTFLQDAGSQDVIFSDSIRQVLEMMKEYQQEGKHISSQFLRENFLHLDIFYRELNIEEIRQQIAYDMAALLSDVGGTLGLFIGASVLSLFELLDLLFMTSYQANVQVARKVATSRRASAVHLSPSKTPASALKSKTTSLEVPPSSSGTVLVNINVDKSTEQPKTPPISAPPTGDVAPPPYAEPSSRPRKHKRKERKRKTIANSRMMKYSPSLRGFHDINSP